MVRFAYGFDRVSCASAGRSAGRCAKLKGQGLIGTPQGATDGSQGVLYPVTRSGGAPRYVYIYQQVIF
jgi:hypothetical protein